MRSQRVPVAVIAALAAALVLLPGCHDTTDSVLNTILLAFEIVEVWF